MLAIDTNVIVRFLKDDDPIQSPRARALVEAHVVRVSATVVLETEWVLRDVYEMPKNVVLAELRKFFGNANVEVESPYEVREALAFAEAGMDFADALHLACARGCEAFATFDKDLARKSKRIAKTPVRLV